MKIPTIPLSTLRKKNKSPTHHVLADDKAFSTSGLGVGGDGFDSGSSTANGGTATLRVSQISGDVYEFVLGHGDTYASESLTTFTINGTAITSEQKEITGTIQRFVDLTVNKISGTAGPIKVTCTLKRN
jgi:hypothetical protein